MMKRIFLFLLAVLLMLPLAIPAAAEYPEPTIETMPPMPRVTKDPTDERVREDGYCEFVARADYAKDIIWHLISPDGTRDILAKNAPHEFPGVWISGLNSECLGIDHIQLGLDKWHVRAEFVGYVGNLYSMDAVIYIDPIVLEEPVITVQPRSQMPDLDEEVTLDVLAAPVEEYATLSYQWYESRTGRTEGGLEIDSAWDAAYTPPQIPGTRYYYCALYSTDGTHTSPVVLTQCVSVTWPFPTEPPTTEATEDTAPTETESPSEVVTTPVETEPEVYDVPAEISPTAILYIVGGLIAGILLIGSILLISDAKRKRRRKYKNQRR